MIDLLDTVVVVLIVATAPAANIFPFVYLLTTRWRDTLPSRALLVKSLSTMLLIDLALLVRVVEIDELTAAVFRTMVMSLIFAGVNLMTFALLREKLPHPRVWLPWLRAWLTRLPRHR